jgi:hypothetical protein
MCDHRFVNTPLGRIAEDTFRKLRSEFPGMDSDVIEAAVVQAMVDEHWAFWKAHQDRFHLSDEELCTAAQVFYYIMDAEPAD